MKPTLIVALWIAATGCGEPPVPRAQRLAARDATLSARLAARDDAWRSDGGSLTSAGLRRGRLGARPDLGVTLPAKADGPFQIGLGAAPGFRISLTPEGARPSVVGEQQGFAVYRSAYPATDLLWIATHSGAEQLFVLDGPRAPSELTFRVELPDGLPRARQDGAGGLDFLDAGGTPRLYVPPPFAIDAAGTRRAAELGWDGARLTIRLRPDGLRYPILLDPAFEVKLWVPVTNSGPTQSGSDTFTATDMVYDSGRNRVDMIGYGVPHAVLWELDGSVWTRISPDPPDVGALAYDSLRHRLLLFDTTAETWSWDGTQWTKLVASGAGPSARTSTAMAYDPDRDRVVLFGGTDTPCCSLNVNALSDTWEFDGTAWAQITATPSWALFGHHMFFDNRQHTVVCTAGHTTGSTLNPLVGTTFWYEQGTPPVWTSASNLYIDFSGASWAFDSIRKSTIIYARQVTYEGETSFMVQSTNYPSQQVGGTATFDAGHGRMIIWGGGTGTLGGTINDTWAYYSRGGACASGGDCDTGYCVDGVCCESPSCGTCQACNLPGTQGTCAAVVNIQDPDSCAGQQSCDGAGTCKGLTGATCNADALCLGGFCRDGYCCDLTCDGGPCQACNGGDHGWPTALNGKCQLAPPGSTVAGCPAYVCGGASTMCGTGCATDTDCTPDHYCAADASCVPRKAPAAACNAAAGADCRAAGCRVCASVGGCVDGFCCDKACGGPCDDCRTVAGSCLPSAKGSAGAPACGLYVCNGSDASCPTTCAVDADCGVNLKCKSGVCSVDNKLMNGQQCVFGAQCFSTFCADGYCCNEACTADCRVCNASGSLGVCSPSPMGSAPHGSCQGDGACAGTCDGTGTCTWPGAGPKCDVCKTCDGAGHCSALPQPADDPACMAVSCGALSTECRRFLDPTLRCVQIGLCAASNDPVTCTQTADAPDGTPCAGGACRAGECVNADGGATPPGTNSGGCAVGGDGPVGAYLLVLALLAAIAWRSRRRRSGVKAV
jgi:hypothetical protein